MQAFPQGKITVAAAGTPVQLPAKAGGVCRIRVAAIVGETGRIYLGTAGLVKSSFVGVIKDFWPTGVSGAVADTIDIEPQDGADLLHPDDYYLDAAVSGEGALVTYWVR